MRINVILIWASLQDSFKQLVSFSTAATYKTITPSYT